MEIIIIFWKVLSWLKIVKWERGVNEKLKGRWGGRRYVSHISKNRGSCINRLLYKSVEQWKIYIDE